MNNEVKGASQTPAQAAQTGVPEWIEPDKMYRLVSTWACHLTIS